MMMIDDVIGEIFEFFEVVGKFDNMIIIFNSDYGDYMGVFNLFLKGFFVYDLVNCVFFIWVDL